MKITPIDIQQMVFQVKFRGFDRDEVNRFLEELALTVENLNRDNSALPDGAFIDECPSQPNRKHRSGKCAIVDGSLQRRLDGV